MVAVATVAVARCFRQYALAVAKTRKCHLNPVAIGQCTVAIAIAKPEQVDKEG